MKLFADRILIQPEIPQDEIRTSGLIIPAPSTQSLPTGEVIEVGDTVASVKIGDKVLFSIHDGQKHGDKIILRETGVIAVL